MNKGITTVLCLALILSLSACKKKDTQETVDAINLDTLETINTSNETAGALDSNQITLDSTMPQATGMSIPMDLDENTTSSQETKSIPDAKDIQRALKNAGYYSGAIDGKIGPKSKAAIKEFQMANDLTGDGKIGAKTWLKLSQYSESQGSSKTSAASTTTNTKKTKRDVSLPPSAR